MRQLNPSSNLVLAILAGLGVVASLSMAWFAAPTSSPNETDGPVERGAYQVAHTFATSAKGTVDGATALGDGRIALMGLVALIAVLALAIAANVARQHAEEALRLVALALPAVLVVVAFSHPGTTTPVQIHYGTLVGLAAALLTASAAWHGASWREKHAAPVRPRYGR